MSYDPASCPTDAGGMIYLAYGRSVLRFPADVVRDFEIKQEEERMGHPAPLIAPDPTAPLGCPGNPMQLYTHTIWYAGVSALPKGEWPYPAKALKRLRLSPVGLDSWGPQDSQEKLSIVFCDLARTSGKVKELDNGLTECAVRPNVEIPQANWGRSYRAKPEVYSAPFGRPFVVICLVGGTILPQQCTVSYRLFPNLNIYYWIQRDLFGTPDFTDFIAVDRVIRGPLEAALVEGYRWAEESPAINAPKEK